MADITYTRAFQHEDWVDNEDVVQAGGEKGFNQKFHAIESEFDSLTTVVSEINTEINNIQRLIFVSAQAPFTLSANTASAEFAVETYNRTGFPANIEKVYFALILPATTPAQPIQHTFLYRLLPNSNVEVKVMFFNPGTAVANFGFRILTLAAQA
jgi:hypothetical protein